MSEKEIKMEKRYSEVFVVVEARDDTLTQEEFRKLALNKLDTLNTKFKTINWVVKK